MRATATLQRRGQGALLALWFRAPTAVALLLAGIVCAVVRVVA